MSSSLPRPGGPHLPILAPHPLALLMIVFPFTVGSDPPTSCCFTYTSRQLPRSFVVEYYETNSQCSQPAVVFVTRKGREVCANPEQEWVQKYMSELELN
ncbi:C-C motif chemokine 4 homolog isoform X1 [Phaenicophaeus curvirostris]|uniref:C-C motif chemokine 4 homolog isoform X1 n=1 Tax=Phaenicophaeus curvirostris TaxID=33595 RepID=UPI0037F0EB22